MSRTAIGGVRTRTNSGDRLVTPLGELSGRDAALAAQVVARRAAEDAEDDLGLAAAGQAAPIGLVAFVGAAFASPKEASCFMAHSCCRAVCPRVPSVCFRDLCSAPGPAGADESRGAPPRVQPEWHGRGEDRLNVWALFGGLLVEIGHPLHFANANGSSLNLEDRSKRKWVLGQVGCLATSACGTDRRQRLWKDNALASSRCSTRCTQAAALDQPTNERA